MNKTIYTLRYMPSSIDIGGDYYITQSALLLAGSASGEVILKNPSRGKDTESTSVFLQSLGCRVISEERDIKIFPPERLSLPEKGELYYEGGLYPLCLIIGLMAGMNISSTLRYGKEINQKFLDYMAGPLREVGVGIKHDQLARTIVFEPYRLLPIERKISSPLPHLKNCLLMLGVISGRSIAIREEILTGSHFEDLIGRLGGRITVVEPGTEIVEDINDPRKKVRQIKADYKREMILHTSTRLKGDVLIIPADSFLLASLLTLAVLKKCEFAIDSVPLHSDLANFLNYLKSIGIEIIINNRRNSKGQRMGDLQMRGREIKGRKIAGDTAVGLLREIPLIALLAAIYPGTTLIRDIGIYSDFAPGSFNEIAIQLGRMGIKCGILEDGLIIEGKSEINGADFGPCRNGEIGVAFYLAALAGHGKSTFENFEVVRDSFPDLVTTIENSVGKKVPSKSETSP